MNNNEKDNTTPHKAEQYDVEVKRTVPFYDLFYSQTIDLVKSSKPEVKLWLDTRCGTGSLTKEAFAHFPNAIFILADPSQNILDEAKTKLELLPPSQVSFLAPAGTEKIALDDGVVPDVITAIQCHHYLNAATRIIATKKCYGMLTDGGIYIMFENIRPFSAEGISLGFDVWKRYQLSQGRDEKTTDIHIKRFDTSYFPISVIAHIVLLWYSNMQAGFYAIK
jgi:tRNA (cmo5U34)-methyltransferase